MAREPGAGWRRGWGYMGGGWGFSGATCPRAGSPAQLPAQPFTWRGGCTCLGGAIPLYRGRGQLCLAKPGADGGRVLWISAGSPSLFPWLFP